MASKVDICNIALGLVGVNQTIQSIDEGSAESRACRVHYESALEQILRTYPWTWAKKRIAPALVGEDLVTGWTYTYAYPSDCVKIIAFVNTATRTPDISESIQFEVANYNGSKVINTDEAEAELIYTFRVSNEGIFDAQFVEAFATLLASKITMTLGHPEMQSSLLQQFYPTAAEAFASCMNESNMGPEPDSFLWRSRQ